jgi:hypothetical protein
MNKTEKAREIINKHLYLHGGDGLGITDGDVYRAVLDAVSEALTIPVVVGQSEQLKAFAEWCDKQGLESIEWFGVEGLLKKHESL